MSNNRRLGKDSFGKKGTNPPKPSFATTTVKFATPKVQRKKSFTVGCWLSDDYDGEGTGEVFYIIVDDWF